MPSKQVGISLHFGDSDPIVPNAEVARIRAAYQAHDCAEIAVCQGAQHNFAMPEKAGYQRQADETSKAKVLELLKSLVL